MFCSLRVALLCAVAAAESTWGPADSVHALDGVIVAVDKIVHLPHLSAKQLEEAKKMAADVKENVDAVESGKLSKKDADARVAKSMKELSDFGAELSAVISKASAPVNVEQRMAELKEELAKKKAELQKVEQMMTVMKLKKELAEKQLALDKLLASKAKAQQGQTSDADEAKTIGEIVNDVEAGSKTAMAAVKAQEKIVEGRISRLDAEEKKSEAMIEDTLKTQLGPASAKDALVKGQALIKSLAKREKRKFAKARAQDKVELDGLKTLESSLEKGDKASVKQALQQVEQQSKALQAKSGKFLY
jgi:hypothetical protein